LFDAERFLIERNHSFKKSGPEVSSRWIGVPCKLCGDTSGHTHGAFSKKTGNYNCWRCGNHPLYKVIAEMENCSYRQAIELIKKYSIDSQYEQEEKIYAASLDIAKVADAEKMNKHHRHYLQKRNFDDKFLEKEYGLLGTGFLGDYPHRIIAPIIYKNQEVSFTSRTIIDRPPTYLFCKSDKEVVHYKNILYNLDKIKNNIILVEGVTDVWRIGRGAVASFGLTVTEKQLVLLLTTAMEHDTTIFVCLDPEPVAQKKAKKIVQKMKSIYDKVYNIVLTEDEDPGAMKESDIKVFRKEFGL
jgi:DNA primase